MYRKHWLSTIWDINQESLNVNYWRELVSRETSNRSLGKILFLIFSYHISPYLYIVMSYGLQIEMIIRKFIEKPRQIVDVGCKWVRRGTVDLPERVSVCPCEWKWESFELKSLQLPWSPSRRPKVEIGELSRDQMILKFNDTKIMCWHACISTVHYSHASFACGKDSSVIVISVENVSG